MKLRWLELLAHILFWILTTLLIVSIFSVTAQEVEIINGEKTVRITRDGLMVNFLITGQFFAIILAYCNVAVIKGLSRDISGQAVFFRSTGLFFGLLGMHYLLTRFVFFPEFLRPAYLQTGIFVFYYALSLAYGMAMVWIRTEAQKKALTFGKQQAELHLLRSQLQPHFLFNTLNNLLAMVDQQRNPMLAESIERLSGLLRYVVYETADNQVTVAREMDFLKDFAELQLLRFEPDEVDFRFEIEGDFTGQLIEPGIFVPFVENAFKHGVQPEQKSYVEVHFDVSQDNKVVFTLSNSKYASLTGNADGGSGLKAVKERLNLVYPGKHDLMINHTNPFLVRLELITHAHDHR